jgi:hypothetical protein
MNLCYEYLECVGYDNLFYAELLVNKALTKELLDHQTSIISSACDVVPDQYNQIIAGNVNDQDVLKLPVIRQLELRSGKKATTVFDESSPHLSHYKKSQSSVNETYQRGSVASVPCSYFQHGCGPFQKCVVIQTGIKVPVSTADILTEPPVALSELSC